MHTHPLSHTLFSPHRSERTPAVLGMEETQRFQSAGPSQSGDGEDFSGGAKEIGANHICPTGMGLDFALRAEEPEECSLEAFSAASGEMAAGTGPSGQMQPKHTVLRSHLAPQQGHTVHTQ